MAEERQTAEPPQETVDFDNLPEGDGFLVLSSDKKVLSANVQAERLLRRKLNRGEFFDILQFVNRQYRSQAEAGIQEAMEGGVSSSNLMARVFLDSGLPVSLTFSINPLINKDEDIIGVLITLHDNASAKASPEVLDRNQMLEYDSLFENLAEGVFTINTRWRITSFNQRAQEITGFKRDEVIGKCCWDIFKSDLCHSNCPLKITMETGVVYMDQDVRIVSKSGLQQSILVNTSVIKNKRDLVVGAVETFRPVAQIDSSLAAGNIAPKSRVDIIGKHPHLVKLLGLLPDIAVSEVTVVIEGESGTGKELIAKSIHYQSPRARGPFVPVNCSALAETLLESELFGHVKAAFTGAQYNKVGRFELAKGGTLFLDEIGEIKPEIQVKLLRVIEERVFERVGGTRRIFMDARIIAATNKNLLQEVREGRFREDLFYRLRTVPLYVSPLRERPSDIPLLIEHFVSRFNERYKKNVRGVDPKVMSLFKRYSWPGNVRELERALEYAFVFVKGPIITTSHLPELGESKNLKETRVPKVKTDQFYWEDEKITVQKALKKANGRREVAANLLGISRTSLWRKMKTHGLL